MHTKRPQLTDLTQLPSCVCHLKRLTHCFRFRRSFN